MQHRNAGLPVHLGETDAQLLAQCEPLASTKAARLACSARMERLFGSSTAAR